MGFGETKNMKFLCLCEACTMLNGVCHLNSLCVIQDEQDLMIFLPFSLGEIFYYLESFLSLRSINREFFSPEVVSPAMLLLKTFFLVKHWVEGLKQCTLGFKLPNVAA